MLLNVIRQLLGSVGGLAASTRLLAYRWQQQKISPSSRQLQPRSAEHQGWRSLGHRMGSWLPSPLLLSTWLSALVSAFYKNFKNEIVSEFYVYVTKEFRIICTIDLFYSTWCSLMLSVLVIRTRWTSWDQSRQWLICGQCWWEIL